MVGLKKKNSNFVQSKRSPPKNRGRSRGVMFRSNVEATPHLSDHLMQIVFQYVKMVVRFGFLWRGPTVFLLSRGVAQRDRQLQACSAKKESQEHRRVVKIKPCRAFTGNVQLKLPNK